MSRKHFNLIVEAIRESEPKNMFRRMHMAHIFASKLASINPNFKREKFIDACMK